MYDYKASPVAGAGLGVSYSSAADFGAIWNASSLGSSNVNVAFNVSNGNVFVQDHVAHADELNGGVDIGYVYNSLSDAPWQLNVPQLTDLPTGASPTITFVEADGHETTYTYSAVLEAYVPPLIKGRALYQLKQDGDNWSWFNPITGEHKTFTAQGYLASSTNAAGMTTLYEYSDGELSAIVAPSQNRYTLARAANSEGGITVTVTMSEASGDTVLQTYAFDVQNRLLRTTIGTGTDTYSVEYTYVNNTSMLYSMTQSDTTSMMFGYDPESDYTKVSSITAGTEQTQIDYVSDTQVILTDAAGQATTIMLDAEQRLHSVTRQISLLPTDTSTETTTVAYNPFGQLESIEAPNGSLTRYQFDLNWGMVRLEQRPNGQERQWVFDQATGQLSAIVDVENDPALQYLTTRYIYDDDFNQVGGQRVLRFVITSSGAVTEYRCDAYGLPTSTREYLSPYPGIVDMPVAQSPSLDEMQTWAADPATASQVTLTTMTNNSRGQLEQRMRFQSVTAQGAGNFEQPYNDTIITPMYFGGWSKKIESLDGAATLTTEREHNDALHRLTQTTVGVGLGDAQTTAHSYDDAQNQVTTTLPNDHTTTQTRNTAGRLASILETIPNDDNPQTRITHIQTDQLGRTCEVTKPSGYSSYQFYDKKNRLVFELDPLGGLVEHHYDDANNFSVTAHYATPIDLSKLIIVPGVLPDISTLMNLITPNPDQDRHDYKFYDDSHRLRFTVNSVHAVTEYTYDSTNKLTGKIEYNDALTDDQLQQLLNGELITLTPDTTQDRYTRYFYDEDGRKIAEQDPAGYVTQTVRDSAGRVFMKNTYATPAAFRLTLDELLEAAAPIYGTTYQLWDARDRLLMELDAEGYLTQHTYYNSGKRQESVRYATQLQTVPTVPADLLTMIPPASVNDRHTTAYYDALNRLNHEDRPFGLETTTTYNNMNQALMYQSQDTGAEGDPSRYHCITYNEWGAVTGEAPARVVVLLEAATSQAEKDAIWAANAIVYTYDPETNLKLSRSEPQYESSVEATDDGVKPKSPEPTGERSTTYYYYNKVGKKVFSVNARGAVTFYDYNAFQEQTVECVYANRLTPAQLLTLTGGFIAAKLEAMFKALSDPSEDVKNSCMYNQQGKKKTETKPRGFVTEKTYTNFGQVEKETVPVENQTQLMTINYGYEQRGLKTSKTKTDQANNTLKESFEYKNALGKRTSYTNADSEKTTYGYDKLGRRVSVTNALDETHTLKLDAFNRVISEINALNQVKNNTYNQTDRTCVTQQLGDVDNPAPAPVTVGTSTRNAFGEIVKKADGLGNATTFERGVDGQVEVTEDALGNQTLDAFDPMGKHRYHTDADGVLSLKDYDEVGNLTLKVTDPLGMNNQTSYEFDTFNHRVNKQDPNGINHKTSYDQCSNKTSEVLDPNAEGYTGLAITHTRTFNAMNDEASDVLSDADHPDYRTTTRQHDGFGRRNGRTIDPDGIDIIFANTLDAQGRVIQTIDPNGNPVLNFYNDVGNKCVNVLANGSVRQWIFDASNREVQQREYAAVIDSASITSESTLADVLALIEPQQIPQDKVEYTVYDFAGRVGFVVDNMGAVTQTVYDAASNKVQTIGYPKAWPDLTQLPTLTFAEIEAGLEQISDPTENRITYHIYDGAKRERFEIDGEGYLTQKIYDGVGQKITEVRYATQLADPSSIASMGVDQVLAYIDDEANHFLNPSRDRTTYYVFDALGRPQFTVNGVGSVSYFEHDGNGNLLSSTVFSQQIETIPADYDELVALLNASYTDPDPDVDEITSSTFDHANRKLSTTDAAQRTEGNTYNPDNTKATFTKKNQQTWNYGYDTAGRRTTETAPAIDIVDVVPDVNNPNALSASQATSVRVEKKIVLDKVGNKKSVMAAANVPSQSRTISFTYGPANEVTSVILNDVRVDNPTASTSNSTRPETIETITMPKKYNGKGRLVVDFNESGVPSFNVFDADNRRIFMVNAKGYVIQQIHNVFGEVVGLQQYKNPLNVDLSEYEKTGIPLDVFTEENLPPSSQDRTVTIARNRLGLKTQSLKAARIYYIPRLNSENLSEPLIGTAQPEKKFVYNAFREIIHTQELISPEVGSNPAVWSENFLWHDQDGKVIATVNPNGSVSLYSMDGFGNQKTLDEFAQSLTDMPTDEMTYAELEAICQTLTNAKDRHYEFGYDLLNRDTSKSILNVNYQSVEYTTGSTEVNTSLPTQSRLAMQTAVPEGLVFEAMPKDGHCFYRAVSMYVDQSVVYLRRLVAAHLLHNIDEFFDFVPGDEAAYLAYVNQIATTNVWADQLEMQVLQRLLDRPVIVIRPNNEPLIPDHLDRFGGSPIFVYYNGLNHYDALTVAPGFHADEILARLLSGEFNSVNTSLDNDKNDKDDDKDDKSDRNNKKDEDDDRDGTGLVESSVPSAIIQNLVSALTTGKAYTPTGKVAALYNEVGGARYFYYNAVDDLIATTNVTRDTIDRNKASITSTPLESYEVNAHHQTVVKSEFINGTSNPQINVLPVPSNVDPDSDRETLTWFSNRGKTLAKQDPRDVMMAYTYTATDKKAREWYPLTNISPSETVETILRVKQYVLDDLNRLTTVKVLSNDTEALSLRTEFVFNAFNEVIQKGDATSLPVMKYYDVNGSCWLSNDTSGSYVLRLQDLRGKNTVSVQSALIDLSTLTYDQVISKLQDTSIAVEDLERTQTVHDLSGQAIGTISPGFNLQELSSKDSTQVPSMPLTVIVGTQFNTLFDTRYSFSWAKSNVTSIVPSSMYVWPVGTILKQEMTIRAAGDRYGIDLSFFDLNGQYEYEINFSYVNPPPGKSTADILYQSKGVFQAVLPTPISGGTSIAVSVEEDGTTIQVSGKIAGVTTAQLYEGSQDGKRVGEISLTLDSGEITLTGSLASFPAGTYVIAPDYSVGETGFSLPFTVCPSMLNAQPYNTVPINVTLSAVSIEMNEADGKLGQLSWTLPEMLASNTVDVFIQYIDDTGENREFIRGSLSPDLLDYNLTFDYPVREIVGLTLAVVVEGSAKPIPILPETSPATMSGLTYMFADQKKCFLYSNVALSSEPNVSLFLANNSLSATWIDCSVEYVSTEYNFAMIDISFLPSGAFPYQLEQDTGSIQCVDFGSFASDSQDAGSSFPSVLTYPFNQTVRDRWRNIIERIDPLLNSTFFDFNYRNQVLSRTLPVAAVVQSDNSVVMQITTSYSGYDQVGFQVASQDGNGHITAFVNNAAGQTGEKILPEGTITKTSGYDGFSREAIQIDCRGVAWNFYFDKGKNILKEVTPSGISLYTYNQVNSRTSATTPLMHKSVMLYDVGLNISDTYSPLGVHAIMTYDRNKKLLTQTTIDGSLSWDRNFWGDELFFWDLSKSKYTTEYDKKYQAISVICAYPKGVEAPHGTRSASNPLTGLLSTLPEPTPPQNQQFGYTVGRVTSIIDHSRNMITEKRYSVRGYPIYLLTSMLADDGIFPESLIRFNHTSYDSRSRPAWVTDNQTTFVQQFDGANNRRYVWFNVLNRIVPDNLRADPASTVERYSTFDAADRVLFEEAPMIDGVIALQSGAGALFSYVGDFCATQTFIPKGYSTPITSDYGYYLSGLLLSVTGREGVDGHLPPVYSWIYDADQNNTQFASRDYTGISSATTNTYTNDGYIEESVSKQNGNTSTTNYRDFTADGQARKQVTKYSGKGNVVDTLTASFAEFESLLISGRSGTRSDDYGANYSVMSVGYDANTNMYSVEGAQSSNSSDSTNNFILLTDPEGRVLSHSTITGNWNAPIPVAQFNLNLGMTHYSYDSTGQILCSYKADATPISPHTIFWELFSELGYGVLPEMLLPNYTLEPELNFAKPIAKNSLPNMPSSYIVQEGDTFSTISSKNYGSSTYAAQIALANGYSDTVMPSPGQTLRLPQIVPLIDNLSSAVPYQQFLATVIGPLMLHMRTKQPHHEGFWDELLSIVVSVVVATFAPQLLPWVIPYLAGTGVLASTLLGMANAAVTDAVSQGVAIAVDEQSSFSWSELADAVISAGVSPQVAAEFSSSGQSSNFLDAFMKSAALAGIEDVGLQLVEMADGTRKKFNFSQLSMQMLSMAEHVMMSADKNFPTGTSVSDYAFDSGVYAAEDLLADAVVYGTAPTAESYLEAFGNELASDIESHEVHDIHKAYRDAQIAANPDAFESQKHQFETDESYTFGTHSTGEWYDNYLREHSGENFWDESQGLGATSISNAMREAANDVSTASQTATTQSAPSPVWNNPGIDAVHSLQADDMHVNLMRKAANDFSMEVREGAEKALHLTTQFYDLARVTLIADNHLFSIFPSTDKLQFEIGLGKGVLSEGLDHLGVAERAAGLVAFPYSLATAEINPMRLFAATRMNNHVVALAERSLAPSNLMQKRGFSLAPVFAQGALFFAGGEFADGMKFAFDALPSWTAGAVKYGVPSVSGGYEVYQHGGNVRQVVEGMATGFVSARVGEYVPEEMNMVSKFAISSAIGTAQDASLNYIKTGHLNLSDAFRDGLNDSFSDAAADKLLSFGSSAVYVKPGVTLFAGRFIDSIEDAVNHQSQQNGYNDNRFS